MPNLDEMDDAALEALMRDPAKLAELEAETEAIQKTTPDPEPSPQEPEVHEPAPEPEQAEPEKEVKKEPEPVEDLEKEQLKAVIAELEARQKVTDSKLGRFAGEADYWRKQAERVKARPEPTPDTAYAEEAESEVRETKAPEPKTSDTLTSWVVTQAINLGMQQFHAEHPEAGDMQQEIADYLKESGYNPARIFDAADPVVAQKESYRALDEAYWHVKAARSAKMRADIEKKRADQFARQKEAKQRASISASGSVPAPKPVAKTLDTMTDAELDAELRRLTR